MVRRIFAFYAADRGGYATLAGLLNDEGIPAPAGGEWVGGTIRDLLCNPIYVGDLIWNRESSSRFFRVAGGKLVSQDKAHRSARSPRKRTTYRANDPANWIRLENHHEALVERSTYEQVREVMKRRGQGRGRKRGQRPVHPLSGLVFCASCGQPIAGSASSFSRNVVN